MKTKTKYTMRRVSPSEITMSTSDRPHTKNWSFNGWSGTITRQEDWSSKVEWNDSSYPNNKDCVEDAVRYQNNVG